MSMFRSGFLLSMLRFNILSNYSRMVVVWSVSLIVLFALFWECGALSSLVEDAVSPEPQRCIMLEQRWRNIKTTATSWKWDSQTSWFMKVETCWIIWWNSAMPGDATQMMVRSGSSSMTCFSTIVPEAESVTDSRKRVCWKWWFEKLNC